MALQPETVDENDVARSKEYHAAQRKEETPESRADTKAKKDKAR